MSYENHFIELCILSVQSEGDDTWQHSDLDEQVYEEEDTVEYHPEDTGASDESDESDEEVQRCYIYIYTYMKK